MRLQPNSIDKVQFPNLCFADYRFQKNNMEGRPIENLKIYQQPLKVVQSTKQPKSNTVSVIYTCMQDFCSPNFSKST